MLKHDAREARGNRDAGKPDPTNRAKTRKGEYDLASMLDQVEPANCHTEHDTDPAQGKEEW